MSLVPQTIRPTDAQSTVLPWIECVYRHYETLIEQFPLDPEQGIGGRLIFAGELQPESTLTDALVTAANIAGAATLVAAPNSAAQRRAMRDALADFVVNSVEEALRILKNEVRQRRAVSVAVAISAEHLIEEMQRRGVQPDVLPATNSMPTLTSSLEIFQRNGARAVQLPAHPASVFVVWQRELCCGSRMTPAETAARQIISDSLRLRWLRLAPRYLGRASQRVMGVGISAQEHSVWSEAMRNQSDSSALDRVHARGQVLQA